MARTNSDRTTPRDAIEREGSIPAIPALRAFVLAAHYRNFSRAADELNITQSGVSRAVRSIEELTGTTLFERTGHGLVLTEPGAAYLEDVSAVLGELGAATLRLGTYKSTSEKLHLATLPSLGSRWLAPRIGRFIKQNPGLDITVSAQIGQFEFDDSDVDATIHYGTETWPGTLSELLMDEVLVPCCVPALIDRHATPGGRLLVGMTLIQHTHRPTAWREWFRDVAIAHPNPNDGPRFEQYQMGIEAALAGLGAILMPPFMVMGELASGRLVPLHGRPVASPWRYYLIYPKAKRGKPGVQRLRGWLRSEARQTLAETLRLFPQDAAG
jgi:DNA-binding transcriptional LysR family regulator